MARRENTSVKASSASGGANVGKNQCICFVGVLLTPEVAGFQLSHHSLGHDQLSEVLNVPKIAKTPGYPNFLTEGPAQTVLHLKLQSFTCTP